MWPSAQPHLGADGKPLPQVYVISGAEAAKIPYRLLDAVNALRQAKGAPALNFNAALNAAALTHARDMSVQNRPWHFGSDGSSPLVRVQRVGYTGQLLRADFRNLSDRAGNAFGLDGTAGHPRGDP